MNFTATELENYFWKSENHITTNEGVEIVLHASSLVELSVLLRNEEEYTPRYQINASFYSLNSFMNFFSFENYQAIHKISVADMLALYRIGYAHMEVA
ncbi:hypothetical protein [Pedobacter nutrimenti]|uniref:Uncharacterized protein n=1 Tax=Pedobacter nutrimenti TaxID=1241337 RepID=A0A318UD11_9SPHI|nr:hypothetical protein [Pedobacter nutrimenti]PYF74101.1 hypothetical protein B0O44_104272 [Pedobacter nutrimenti]